MAIEYFQLKAEISVEKPLQMEHWHSETANEEEEPITPI